MRIKSDQCNFLIHSQTKRTKEKSEIEKVNERKKSILIFLKELYFLEYWLAWRGVLLMVPSFIDCEIFSISYCLGFTQRIALALDRIMWDYTHKH